MKVIIEGSVKEIAALVLELQERHEIPKIKDLLADESGVHLCSNDVLKD